MKLQTKSLTLIKILLTLTLIIVMIIIITFCTTAHSIITYHCCTLTNKEQRTNKDPVGFWWKTWYQHNVICSSTTTSTLVLPYIIVESNECNRLIQILTFNVNLAVLVREQLGYTTKPQHKIHACISLLTFLN